jgi:hypothetical protein
MNVLRILSLLAAVAVLLAPPIMLTDAGTGNWPIMVVVASLLLAVAISGIFIYIGANGERMIRKRPQRKIGGLLLLIPIVTGLVLMVTRPEFAQMVGSGMLLGFSLLLFLSFVYPAIEAPSRPMRERDRQDPNLHLLPPSQHG